MKLLRGVHITLTSIMLVVLLVAVAAAADMRIQQKQTAPTKQAPARMQKIAPVMKRMPSVDMRADLTLSSCVVECSRGGAYSVQNCQQYGYSDQYSFKVSSVMRNEGANAASIEEGWRVWSATHQVGSGAPAAIGYAEHQTSPPGGIYLTEGAEVPGSRSPTLTNLKNLAPGVHTIVLTADPDNRIAEKSESNNTSQCSWTVVAGQPLPPFDMTITSVSVSPSSGPPTTAFQYTVTVKNIGGPAPSLANWNVTCQPGGGFNGTRLEENESVTRTLPVHGTLTPGQKTMVCEVDAFQPEQNTSNNTKTTTFTVTQP